MKTLLGAIGLGSAGMGAVVGMFIALVVLRPVVGALGGWVMGWIFPETMTVFIAWLGLAFAPWQLGLVLGFLAAFLPRTKIDRGD